MAGILFRAATWSYRKCVRMNINGHLGNQQKFHPSIVFSRNATSNTIESETITKNIELITMNGRKATKHRPLAIIFSWMLAKKSHIMKYGDFYINQGFDVLTVKITPYQLFWPTIGSQVIVGSLLDFLIERDDYQPILIHAFSVGAYMFGETLVKMETERKYDGVGGRIVGQVFDSAADYTEISTGFPKAMTNNRLLQKMLQTYVRFHMSTFYEFSTRHYVRSSDQFHNTSLLLPSLFLFSKNDPIATPESNEKTIKAWKAKGMKVYSHCWERSPHVGHMYQYQDEYLQELENFLQTLGLLAVQKNNSKL